MSPYEKQDIHKEIKFTPSGNSSVSCHGGVMIGDNRIDTSSSLGVGENKPTEEVVEY